MSRHEGVSCDNCLTSNFRLKRFKCLICYDYDLCETCFEDNVSTSRHLPSHPMQCILTKNDFDLFYGGEGITMDNPPSLTCPLCGKRGLTEANLQEHVSTQHIETSVEVVCPICAAIPTGDPNHVTDDFATHLALEHNSGNRAGFEDHAAIRQTIRRERNGMFYPARGVAVRGARAQRSANMHFNAGPSSVPGFGSVANPAAAALPHMRDPYSDPIAELLSQLSGVRRNAQQMQQNVSTASQLQELQAQLQLERQRASIIRQQLERIPGKITSSQNGKQQAVNQMVNSQNKNYASAPKATGKESVTEDEDPRLLLPQVDGKDLEAVSESENTDIFEQSLFVRELILSLPADNDSVTQTAEAPSVTGPAAAVTARAIPVECGVVAAATNGNAAHQSEKAYSNPRAAGEKEAKASLDGGADALFETAAGQSEADLSAENAVLSKESVSDHAVAAPRGAVAAAVVAMRKSNSEEKSSTSLHQHQQHAADLKKESSNLRSPQYSSGAPSNVAGLVRPQSSRPVPSFPFLVAGATEQ